MTFITTTHTGTGRLKSLNITTSELSLVEKNKRGVVAHLDGSQKTNVSLSFSKEAVTKYYNIEMFDYLQTIVIQNPPNGFEFIDAIKLNGQNEFILIDNRLRAFRSERLKHGRKISPLRHNKKLNKRTECKSWLKFIDGIIYCSSCEEVIEY